MLKKLRRKFIALIMAILAIVLTTVLAIVCYTQWSNEQGEAERTLSNAIQMASTDAPQDDKRDMGHPEFSGMPIEGKPKKGEGRKVDIPVAVYIDNHGELESASRSFGWLDSETLAEVQEAARQTKHGIGRIDALGLIYMKEGFDGTIYLAIADASMFDHWESTALTLIGVELAILAIFFLISLAFSRWALKPVQEAWDKQRTFIADASHELKTPIAIISANTSIMLEEPDCSAEERNRWLQSTKKASDNMQELVDDLLSLASMENDASSSTASADNIDTPLQAIDLSRLIDGVILQFESIAFERSATVREHIESDVRIETDKDSAERIVNVLFDNAYKYVDEGGEIDIALSKTDSMAVLAITNTGTTIPQDKLERIFDRFYRVDDARSTGEGHGLGLSIAKAAAEAIGAKLEARSADGKTTLILQIPC